MLWWTAKQHVESQSFKSLLSGNFLESDTSASVVLDQQLKFYCPFYSFLIDYKFSVCSTEMQKVNGLDQFKNKHNAFF